MVTKPTKYINWASVVPGLFFGRAGPAPRARAGKFLRAGAGPTFSDRAAGQGRAGAKK